MIRDEVYYRVYSGDVNIGRFLTKEPPRSFALAREGLALPPANTAEFIQEVFVPTGIRLQRSRALPAYDRRGGMEQFQILEQDIFKLTFGEGKKLE